MRHPLLFSALIFFAIGILSRSVIRHHESRLQILILMGAAVVAEEFARTLFHRPPTALGFVMSSAACAAGVILMKLSIEGLPHG